MTPEEASYVVLDVETTGLNPGAGDRICEIGAIKFRAGREADRYHSLINPGRSLSAGAAQKNCITAEMLVDAPPFEQVAPHLRQFLAGAILVAQNASFDLSFLNMEFERCGMSKLSTAVLDTIALARRVRPNLRTYNLDNLAFHFNVPVGERHRSIGDCEVTAKVFFECLTSLRSRGEVKTLEDLVKKGAPR